MIQRHGLTEADYRGERLKTHCKDLLNNNEALNLTQPDLIFSIHKAYLEAGADIIETNTFNGNTIAQEDFLLADLTYEMNYEAARLAKKATSLFPGTFVAGAVGPTPKTASISRNVDDASFRDIYFEDLVKSYTVSIDGLTAGGADIIMIETIFDTLNAKAAVFAYEEYFKDKAKLPLILSGTLVDLSGRTLSGQTAEAFLISMMLSLCVLDSTVLWGLLICSRFWKTCQNLLLFMCMRILMRDCPMPWEGMMRNRKCLRRIA
jgi:5-methyltetrahydrofolate--homocysteine methyltransferase